MARCSVCFRQCDIAEGRRGYCGGRTCQDGNVIASNYGRMTALALDPIEKKPLRRFHPGSMILSVGSYGCNLRCPFCQNHEISWDETAFAWEHAPVWKEEGRTVTPGQLCRMAEEYREHGSIGIAYTYNEPLVGWEFVRDTARLAREAGLKNVLVTNGTASQDVLEELLPYIDAMNIDLKSMREDYYRDVLGGSLGMVKSFIEEAVKTCHVELTTLIVPGENDSQQEMEELSAWVAGLRDRNGNLIGSEIPLHVSRFFPRFHMTDRQPTPVDSVYRLAQIAAQRLNYVYTGNC